MGPSATWSGCARTSCATWSWTSSALSLINSEVLSFASMAGLVYDEEASTLSLSSLARVWDENEAWLDPFIGMAAALQVGEAGMLAPQLATRLGAEVAISGHPDHGLRAQPDEMAAVIESLVIPTGRGPSVWAPEEFEAAVQEYVDGPVSVSASADGEGSIVEVPFGDLTSRCQVLPAARHPHYGAGLLIVQQLPFTQSTEPEGAGFALVLNGIELAREPLGLRLRQLRVERPVDVLHLLLPERVVPARAAGQPGRILRPACPQPPHPLHADRRLRPERRRCAYLAVAALSAPGAAGRLTSP